MSKYKLLIDMPYYSLRRGSLFEWDKTEGAYTTKDVPWFLTPLVTREEIKDKKIFGVLEELNE